uniref:CSON005083 protein n=1 Tax=Culicoides sonorensis TaxID=179676 RepID=A0A336KA44_CULSO
MCTNESTTELSPIGKSLQYSPVPTSISSGPHSTESHLTVLAPSSQSSPLGASAAPRSSPPTMPTSNGPSPVGGAPSVNPQMHPLDQYRLQLYNYAMAERIRCGQYPMSPFSSPYSTVGPYGPRLALQMSLFHNRMFAPEEPKPQHSYIGLIAMAILGAPEQKMVLSDIYQHILDNYPYFRNRGPGWRNSIRHNLSLNDCFIKSGRSANGKGHYWAIHPANIDDFKRGDFRRRKAQRKVRKHMGLAVDDDGTDSPSPPPLSMTPPPGFGYPWVPHATALPNPLSIYSQVVTRKRQFDVASLLAPDSSDELHSLKHHPAKRFHASSSPNPDLDEDIDVVASDDQDDSVNNDKDTTGGNRSPCSTDDNLHSPPSGNNNPNNTPWSGLMQWPSAFPSLGVGGMDPRIFGRYYGQYMAAAQASRRFNQSQLGNNNNNSTELHGLSSPVHSNDCN